MSAFNRPPCDALFAAHPACACCGARCSCDMCARPGAAADRAGAASGGLRPRSSRGRPGSRPIEACAGASSTISPATSARAMRCNSVRSRSSTPARAKSPLSDLRATTWEDGDAKNFSFASQNFLDRKPVDAVDGRAERKADGDRRQSEQAAAKVARSGCGDGVSDANTCAASSRRREEGKTLLELPVFDGSETGEKVFQHAHRDRPRNRAGRESAG